MPTFKFWIQQIIAILREECITEQQVQAAQEQVVWVHQIITDGWEVTCGKGWQ